MPFVVVRTSVSAAGVPVNSRGELPKSKPSMRTASRSPPSTASPAAAAAARASSTSAQQSTRSYPDATACVIVEVALRTSITIPSGAKTSSAGVKATWTRTPIR